MSESGGKPKDIVLGEGFGDVALIVNGATVEVHADGSVAAYTQKDVDAYTNGAVHMHPAVNDSWMLRDKDKIVGEGRVVEVIGAEPQIGAIERKGEHKGEIYGGIYPADNKPIWFLAAPKLMNHYRAAAWAEGQGGCLPTREQGDYLTSLKGKLKVCPAKTDGGGAFTELFNRGDSFPAGYVWLAEPKPPGLDYAWCQRLSDGDQGDDHRVIELPVLCVVR